MSYLVNKTTGAVTGDLSPDSDAYRYLVGTKAYESVSSEQARVATSRVAVVVFGGSAAGADETGLLLEAQETPINVVSVTYNATALLTGAATNSRTIDVIAGPDRAAPISVASKAFVAGVNAAAGAETPITMVTPAVPAGEPVVARSTHIGTGIADPGGVITLTYTEA